MTTVYVLRTFGGVLILSGTITPPAVPTLLVQATFRDGNTSSQFRDGNAPATYRDGAVTGSGR
jgi:hypothetical protein